MNITNDFREEPWLQPDPPRVDCPNCGERMEYIPEREEYVCPECGWEMYNYSNGGFDPDQKHDENV